MRKLDANKEFPSILASRKDIAKFLNDMFEAHIFESNDGRLTEARCKQLALMMGQWTELVLKSLAANDTDEVDSNIDVLDLLTNDIQEVVENILEPKAKQ